MSSHYLRHVKRIHFIGIGGAGMGGIAEVLLHQGYEISGSDLGQNAMVTRLQTLGATIMLQHLAENVQDADVVVISTAIAATNPELIAAREALIPIVPRAQMLADLMRMKQHGIAVAGTHGKTTTTSLLASILTEAGLDPTFVIGGMLKSAGANAYLGKSPFFVAEADESDASFLYLYPEIAIVTNIDADHMGTYHNDFNQLKNTFVQFLHRLPFNGLAIVCIDDPVIQEILPLIARPILTYGFHPNADIQITDFQPAGFQTHFTLKYAKDEKDIRPLAKLAAVREVKEGSEHRTATYIDVREDSSTEPTNKFSAAVEFRKRSIAITLNLPGQHNALNTAAVCGVALSLGVTETAIQNALEKFSGVGRRMQVYGELCPTTKEEQRVLLIDDYGHHPREINATWTAIHQAWPDRRLVVVYQPHRYTRTRDLFADFVEVLSQQVDQLILLDIYSAGEAPIPGADGQTLFNAVLQQSKNAPVFVQQIDELPNILEQLLKDGDVLLTQGAGSVGTLAPKLVEKWREVSTPHLVEI